MALIYSIKEHTQRTKAKGQTEPGFVTFYDIRPGNGAVYFYNPVARRGQNSVTYRNQPAPSPSQINTDSLQCLQSNMSTGHDVPPDVQPTVSKH